VDMIRLTMSGDGNWRREPLVSADIVEKWRRRLAAKAKVESDLSGSSQRKQKPRGPERKLPLVQTRSAKRSRGASEQYSISELKSWICCIGCHLPMWGLQLNTHKCPSVPVVRKVPEKVRDQTKLLCLGCSRPYRVDQIEQHSRRCLRRKRRQERRGQKPNVSAYQSSPTSSHLIARPTVPVLVTPQLTPSYIPGKGLLPRVQRFPFELLPPGTWDMNDVIAHYHRAAAHPNTTFQHHEIDPQRPEKIGCLKPSRCSVGKNGWQGYVLFEFSWTDRVVLECPLTGNATYVLSGNWERMIGRTKEYLRTRHSKECTKVVHKSDWLSRIREAL
jgi:hypothetical protein